MITDTTTAITTKAAPTILIVDDEPGIVELLKTVLSRAPAFKEAKLITAPSGEAALDEVSTWGCDLLLTDFKMTGMDGITLARAVRARHPHARIALFTGFVDDDVFARAKAEGVADICIHKPWTRAELLSLLSPLIAARNAA